jgi:hypothetical protein
MHPSLAIALLLVCSSALAFEGPYVQHSSSIGGKVIGAMPKESFFVESPEWRAGTPLPITEDALVKAARAELSRHVPDAAKWGMAGFDILRFRASRKSLWYFLVHFRGIVPRDNDPADWKFAEISIPVNFRGVAHHLSEVPQ